MNKKERKETVEKEQSTMTRDEIKYEMELKSEVATDLNNLPSVDHNWVVRGGVVNCEGAGHVFHQHFLVERGKRQDIQ